MSDDCDHFWFPAYLEQMRGADYQVYEVYCMRCGNVQKLRSL